MAADGTTYTHSILNDPDVKAQVEREQVRLGMRKPAGVCWSGMQDEPLVARSLENLLAAAEREKTSREAYLTSNTGKARVAIAKGCKAAVAVSSALEDVAAAMSRGDGSAVRKAQAAIDALMDLRIFVADMDAFVRLASAEAA
jgi:hypothetical protein